MKRALKAQEKKEALERGEEVPKKRGQKKSDQPAVKSLQFTEAQLSKLSSYFKKAILTHPDSMTDMKNAILASFFHKCSTDAKPQHQYCPAGADSWCAYQKAVATKQNYNHPPAFDDEVQGLLQPIYEELTDEKVLERCLGKKTLEIAALSAACIFNEGLLPVLKVMEVMGVKIGLEARRFADKANDRRLDRAEHEATEASKEHRTAARNSRILQNDAYEEQEGVVYEAGIDM